MAIFESVAKALESQDSGLFSKIGDALNSISVNPPKKIENKVPEGKPGAKVIPDFLRSFPRSMAELVMKATGIKEFTPETKEQKFLFGKERIEKPVGTFPTALSVLGVIPGLPGKKQLAKESGLIAPEAKVPKLIQGMKAAVAAGNAEKFAKAQSPAFNYFEQLKADRNYQITKVATGNDESRALARLFQQRIDEGKVPKDVLDDFYSKTGPAIDMEVGVPIAPQNGVRASHIDNFFDNPKITELIDAKVLGLVKKEVALARPSLPPAMKIVKEVAEQPITTDTVQNIAEQAARIVERNPFDPIKTNETKRLFVRVAEALDTGEIIPEDLPGILKKYNLSPREFGSLYKETITTAGRELKTLSDLAKRIKKILPEADMPTRSASLWDLTREVYRRADNLRRGAMVSQLSTAVRNTISQTGRYTLQVFDDFLTGIGEITTGSKTFRQGFTPALEDVMALFRRMSPQARKEVESILKEFPLEGARLINTPVGDVTLGNKVVNTLNIVNRTQEYFFRKMMFDARVRSEMLRRGIAPELASQIPEEVIRSAVDQALTVTFAKSHFNTVTQLYNRFPFMTALGPPFIRFLQNSLKFMWDFSPAGITSLFRPSMLRKLASGDREALSVVSKSVLGTMMMASGTAIRNSEYAGEKWYELKVLDDQGKDTGQRVDTRAFGPFTFYLMVGEYMKNPENVTLKDFILATTGVGRIEGISLPIIDILEPSLRGDSETAFKKFKQVISNWISGFTVPFRMISDFIGDEQALVRDKEEYPILGSAMANIPFVQENLPSQPSLLEGDDLKREYTVLRQLSGMTIKTKNFVEKEIDRLRIKPGDLFPKTGVNKLDDLVIRRVGSMMERFDEVLSESTKYGNLPDEKKIDVIKKAISEAKRSARLYFLAEKPYEIARIIYNEMKDKTPEETVKLLKNLKQDGFINNAVIGELQVLRGITPQ